MAHLLKPTSIDGVFEIQTDIFVDQRGSFFNCFRSSEKAFKNCWFDKEIKQVNLSQNSLKGTLRGLHYQLNPNAEMKMVRCIKGSVWDVAVDLRKDSKTYLKWVGEILSGENLKQLWIPQGFGHAFLTLSQSAKVCYKTTNFYKKDSEKTILFSDPKINIDWDKFDLDIITSDKDKKGELI